MDDETVTDPDRVLVGVDGSPGSIQALRHAARMAEAFDAPLEVVTVWAYPPYGSPYIADAWSPEAEAEMLLDDAIATAFGSSPPPLRRTVLAGSAAHNLIEQSRRCALLVVGSRGHGGFAGMLLGSVSAACVRHAHCPVLVVHARSESGEPAASDAGAAE